MKNIKSYLMTSVLTVSMMFAGFSSIANAATLGVPTSVKVTSTSSVITINLHKASGASGTQLGIYTAKGASVCGDGNDLTTFKFSYLKSNTAYQVRLYSVKFVGNTTLKSKTLVYNISTKMTAPASPTKAKVTKYNSKCVKLVWTRAAGATGYEVYRSTAYKGKYIKVATTSNSSFVNSVAKGHYYYYKVRAYKGNASTKVYSPAWSNLTCIRF
ncbi:hypothetical protein [Clostridium psychrophilum]|uniref:hypothetical protein n=1 Tax=Clostridium psychrophilum TaxID=132926 RepID=UPI001C0CE71F|nr:hypothetical protein [Clostridium psychrophilum]MBU3181831.1 hypothetical protein [Clostridium psychrophilum]